MSFRKSKTYSSCYSEGKIIIKKLDQTYIICLNNGLLNFVCPKTREIKKSIGSNDTHFTHFEITKNFIITHNRSNFTQFWDFSSGQIIKTLKIRLKDIMDITANNSGTIAAFSSFKNHINLVAIPEGFVKRKLVLRSVLQKTFFSKFSEKKLFCSSNNGEITVFDTEKRFSKVFSNHFSTVTSFTFDENGNRMVTSSRDKVVSLWDTTDFDNISLIKSILIGESVEDCISNFENNNLVSLIVTGSSGKIKKFDVLKKKFTKKSNKMSSQRVLRIIEYFDDKNEKTIFALTEDKNFVLIKNFEVKKIFVADFGKIDQVKCIPFINKSLICNNSFDIKILNLTTFETELLFGHKNNVTCLDVSKSGEFVVSGSRDKQLRIWNLETKECLFVCEGHLEYVKNVLFTNSEKFCISSGNDYSIKIWKFDNKNNNNNNKIKTIKSIKSIKIQNNEINSIGIASNDSYLGVGTMNGVINLYTFPTLNLKKELIGHKKAVWKIDFSCKERLLVSCSSDKTVKIWSLTTSKCLQTFEGHINSVHGVFFTQDGYNVVSYGSDGKIKIWDKSSRSSLVEQSSLDSTNKINSLSLISEKEFLAATNNSLELWKKPKFENKLDAIDHLKTIKKIKLKLKDEIIEKNVENENELEIKINNEIKEFDNRKIVQQKKIEICQNYLRNGCFREAVSLSLEIQKSQIILNLFKKIEKRFEDKNFLNDISLNNKKISTLLLNLSKWSANNKHSLLVQKILNWLFSNFSYTKLAKIAPGDVLERLSLFSLKKYELVKKLVISSHVLDIF